MTVSYVGSRGQGLVWRKETNAPPLGSTTGPTSLRPFRSTFPQYRSIVEFTNDSNRGTTACSCPSGRTSWHGINTQYNYTLSNCKDYNSGNRDAANAQAANPYNPADNKGPCNFDIRHNFNVGGSYEIPGASIGGGPLQIGTVFTALSGRPFTLRAGHDRQFGSGGERDTRELPGRPDLQLGSRLSLPGCRTRPAR